MAEIQKILTIPSHTSIRQLALERLDSDMHEYPAQIFPETHWKRFATEQISNPRRRSAAPEIVPVKPLGARVVTLPRDPVEEAEEPAVLPSQN